jgi:hypothetical protein
MKKFVYLFVAIVMIASLIGFTTKAEASGYRWEVDVTMAPWTPDHVDNIVGDGALFGSLVKGNSATWDFWVTYKQLVSVDGYTCADGFDPVSGDPTLCQKWVVSGYKDEVCTEDTCPVVQFSASHQIVDVAGHWGPWDSDHAHGSNVENQHRHFGWGSWGNWTAGTCSGDVICEEQHRHWIDTTYKTETFGPIDVQYILDDDECERPSGHDLGVPSWAMDEFNNLDHEVDCQHNCEAFWVDTSHFDYEDATWFDASYYRYTEVEFSGGLPPKVYIPNFDLFLSKEGFGVVGPNSSGLMETVQYCTLLSSTSTAVSVEIIADRCLVGDKKGLGVSALPADLTNPTCSAPVLAPVDLSPGIGLAGTWACDSMLKNIPTAVDGITVNGSRFPLFSSDPDSAAQKATLWYVLTHSPWLTP